MAPRYNAFIVAPKMVIAIINESGRCHILLHNKKTSYGTYINVLIVRSLFPAVPPIQKKRLHSSVFGLYFHGLNNDLIHGYQKQYLQHQDFACPVQVFPTLLSVLIFYYVCLAPQVSPGLTERWRDRG